MPRTPPAASAGRGRRAPGCRWRRRSGTGTSWCARARWCRASGWPDSTVGDRVRRLARRCRRLGVGSLGSEPRARPPGRTPAAPRGWAHQRGLFFRWVGRQWLACTGRPAKARTAGRSPPPARLSERRETRSVMARRLRERSGSRSEAAGIYGHAGRMSTARRACPDATRPPGPPRGWKPGRFLRYRSRPGAVLAPCSRSVGMTRLVFWDVDTLYDFMRADGKLYVRGSEEIIPALEALTGFAHARGSPSWPRRTITPRGRGDQRRARLGHHVSAPLHARHSGPAQDRRDGATGSARHRARAAGPWRAGPPDPGASRRLPPATSGRSTCSPTRTSRPCFGRSSPRRSWSTGWRPISATSTRSRD